MAVGIGLSVRNALAVLEAIFGVKIRIRAHSEIPRGSGRKSTAPGPRKAIASAPGWMPYAEVLLGFILRARLYAIQNENYATVPFLLLFVWGYLYTGLMSLAQVWFERLRFSVEAGEVRPAATGVPGF